MFESALGFSFGVRILTELKICPLNVRANLKRKNINFNLTITNFMLVHTVIKCIAKCPIIVCV